MRVYAGTNHSIPPKSCTTKWLKRQVQNMINGPAYIQVYERSLVCMREVWQPKMPAHSCKFRTP
nr:MAG TPA: hypothetical protein [Caudoviricetes sp.]